MNRSFAKEMRPLLLPWLIAAAGGLLPPGDELESVLGSVLSFGGFAIVAAMVYAIEFQERTLPLLLTQPVDRSRVWRDKLSVTALAAAALACLNWRVHSFLAAIPLLDLGPVFGWVLLCAVICSAGFWIESTHSVLGGVVLAFLVQLLVFLGLGIVAVRSVTLEGQGKEFFISFVNQVATCGVVYCAAFLWLSRQFWKKNAPAKAGVAALVIVLFGLGGIANAHAEAHADSLSTCGAAVFVLATICSAGWWTLLARTTIGGAVLTIASQFIAVIAIRLVLSQLTGSDFSADDRRFWPIVFLGAPLYAALFLWSGWRRFSRLEAREPVYGEGALAPGAGAEGTWGPGWLRCRAGEHWLNLARKEFRLQKPLLLVAALFAVCWLALFGLQFLQPRLGYGILGTVLICLYTPLLFVLAGSMSLGEERLLGVTFWHLTLPISAWGQWLVKIGAGAITAVALGLLLPLAFDFLAAKTNGTGLLATNDMGPGSWFALAAISGGFFVLGFWAATLVPNTIRATLLTVLCWVPLFYCGMAGRWCAQQTCGFPLSFWVVPGADGNPKLAGVLGFVGFIGIVGGIALILGLLQFRRIRIPISTVITHSLVLCGGVLLGSFWWTAVLISIGR